MDHQILISRVMLQAKHDEGGCQCLLDPYTVCMFLPRIDPYDYDGAEAEEEADAQWSPLIAYCEHPNLVYTLEDILWPVVKYLQEQRQADDVTLEDVTFEDVLYFYDNIWNRDN